jgi:alpha-N-acetylglucosaminidase
MLLNFGGRVGLHGRMDALIKGYYDARQKKGKTLKGVGATAEAIENNPVMFELLYELPWRGSKRFTKEDWLPAYTAARYGSANQAVNQAWKLLAEGPYDCPRNYRGQGPVESYFCARPGFFRRSASTWGCADLFYNSSLTRRAAQLMLSASSELGGNANYRYDLVDIVRQCVSDAANDLYGQINNAYKTRDADRLQALSDTFLHYLLMQDKLLATQTDFRVGHWLGQARSLSKQPEVQKLYEWNARTLITVWGNREASERGGLHDYSGREWNGLLADFYYPQWKRFFDNAVKQLRGESSPPVDFFKMEEQWTRDTKAYPSQGEGDAVALAKEVLAEISKKP